VDFPLDNLDMGQYCVSKEYKADGNNYELFAVSNHMGGLGGGHYNGALRLCVPWL
jgi:ubiquitin carboxyl-terminal hydrolase 4/11/15